MEFNNLIFDFDGVLAESVHIKTHAFYKLYEKYGNEIAEKVVKHHKANGGMSRFDKFPYYHKTFLNIELTNEDIEILSNNFSNMVIKIRTIFRTISNYHSLINWKVHCF